MANNLREIFRAVLNWMKREDAASGGVTFCFFSPRTSQHLEGTGE